MASRKQTDRHPWQFTKKLRSQAFGWRGSRLASQRIKEALTEIRSVHRKKPVLGAEGVTLFFERIVNSIQGVDSSSGALGTAVSQASRELAELFGGAPLSEVERKQMVDRIWKAYEADGYGYLDGLSGLWDKLCGPGEEGRKLASRWADEMKDVTLLTWASPGAGYFRGSVVCLSCLLRAERYDELLQLLQKPPHPWWHYREFGARALVAVGKIQEALDYAEATRGLNQPDYAIDRFCEDTLISAGRKDEAYETYAFTSNLQNTNIGTYRAIAKKYPERMAEVILSDLVRRCPPGDEGKWFATAKDLGFLRFALDLVRQSPCDPKTLNRAARDFLGKDPEFALGSAMAALRWLCQGYGYEITGLDVLSIYDNVRSAAGRCGKSQEIESQIEELVRNDQSVGRFVEKSLAWRLGGPGGR